MNRPCTTCNGTGGQGHTLDKTGDCPACNGSGTAEPGPPTSSESPQTLGVTADLGPGTDEGGPGTIEAGQGRFVPNNWPGFAWELDFYGAALLPHQRQGILSAHEATCAQREAQAVKLAQIEYTEELIGIFNARMDGEPMFDFEGVLRAQIAQLRATGTGETDEDDTQTPA